MSMRVVLALLFFLGLVPSAFAQLEPLHPGDTLLISVWQDPKLDRKIVVGPDGMISFPLAGHIKAGGLTPQQLENALRERLQKNYSEKLDISVALADINKDEELLNKPRVYVTGEVLKPGPYTLRPGTTVMQAISLAGGFGPFSAKQRIQVHRQIRGVDTIFHFDYWAYESGAVATDNIHLQSGDIIIVPERRLIDNIISPEE
jgi:polysaccharide biosynthesis/export protein